MGISKVEGTVLKVSEIISADIYYFYAEKHVRHFLGEGALVAIAAFLVGAFCQGFLDYIKSRFRTLGKETGRRVWETAQKRLRKGKHEKDEHLELNTMLSETKAAVRSLRPEELPSSLAHADGALTLVLVYNNYPEEKAKPVARHISRVILATYMNIEVRE